MARPLSEDKRHAILQAATQLFAGEGLGASTARIAKLAGVSEGTVFTYFSSKDELMNQLYLDLKRRLREALVLPPDRPPLRETLWLAWQAYVGWGIADPLAYQAVAKLALAPNITAATRAQAAADFCEVGNLLETAMAGGILRHQSADFVGALLGAMANTTMEFMTRTPEAAPQLCADGFAAFWKAIA